MAPARPLGQQFRGPEQPNHQMQMQPRQSGDPVTQRRGWGSAWEQGSSGPQRRAGCWSPLCWSVWSRAQVQPGFGYFTGEGGDSKAIFQGLRRGGALWCVVNYPPVCLCIPTSHCSACSQLPPPAPSPLPLLEASWAAECMREGGCRGPSSEQPFLPRPPTDASPSQGTSCRNSLRVGQDRGGGTAALNKKREDQPPSPFSSGPGGHPAFPIASPLGRS